MRFSEIKIVVVVTLALGLASAGAGALVLAGGQAVVKVPEASQLTKPPIPSELDKLQGNWITISTQAGGICRLLPEDQRGKLSIRGSVFTFGGPPGSPETAKIEPAQTPKSIDLTPTGDNAGPLKDRAYFGIYAVEDDTLMLCLDIYHQSVRPKEFTTKPGSRDLIDIYKRVGR